MIKSKIEAQSLISESTNDMKTDMSPTTCRRQDRNILSTSATMSAFPPDGLPDGIENLSISNGATVVSAEEVCSQYDN